MIGYCAKYKYGQSMTDYLLIIGLVLMIVIMGMTAVGDNTKKLYAGVSGKIAPSENTYPGPTIPDTNGGSDNTCRSGDPNCSRGNDSGTSNGHNHNH